MKLPFKIEKPLCFIDVETTGTDIAKDKIVQICVVKFMPDESHTVTSAIIDPECEIPTAASDVHGITLESIAKLRLQGKVVPTFKQISKSIHRLIDGCSIGGFNSNNFDIPLISEEFARVDIQWPAEGTLFVDPMVIYKKNEKRDLSTAVEFYCGEKLEGAHSATEDTIAAAKVLIGQINKYEYLQGMTIEELAKESSYDKRLDLAGKLVYNDDGRVVFNFGKHYGKLVYDVFKTDTRYYNWLKEADGFTQNTKNNFKKLYEKIHPPKLL